MKNNKELSSKAINWIIASGVAVVSAVLYFASKAAFVYPGESASLISQWRGLDMLKETSYPLMASFAGLFGYGNAIAPVSGIVAVTLLYLLVSSFVRNQITGEHTQPYAQLASRVAGLVAAAVFMVTPAVRGAATHLEPRMFDFAWMLLAFLPAVFWYHVEGFVSYVFPIVMGVLWGLGLSDSALFLAMLPAVLAICVLIPLGYKRKPYLYVALFGLSFVIAFVIMAANHGGFIPVIKVITKQFSAYTGRDGWMLVLFFTTIPFVVSVFSSLRAYSGSTGWMQWFFHLAMSVVVILSMSTGLSPSALMISAGIFPVATSAFVAVVAGYLISYWLVLAVSKVTINESSSAVAALQSKGRIFAYFAGPVLALVTVFTVLFNLFMFDSDRGSFADAVAKRVIADLGDRTWLVTDGTIDDHLRIVAADQGKELNLVCLSRDLDKDYLERLSAVVKDKKIGGANNADLALSLSLGVLPFVQDWFQVDPTTAKNVAIFGASDLWYSAGMHPVPEFLFFGADDSRTPDWSMFAEFDKILHAPAGWGSYRLSRVKDPIERMRLNLRRHLGLIANNRGVYLQDVGKDDEAFDMYEKVLDNIDTDNICSLFNLFEMARAKHSKAVAKKFQYERRLKAVVDDASRRYRLWSLANYYGYIRNPDIFIRLGFTWARSGRPGDALQQIRRAIDFIPTDRRGALMNMMAALYANDNDRVKSREVYEQVLEKDKNNHAALIGLMRLSLLDGDSKKALEYLERATKVGGDDPRIQVELAMVALMKNELEKAKGILRKLTDANPKDLRSWSLLAAVVMQQFDSCKDEKLKKSLQKEIEETILPTMEKQSRNPYDYYLQTTRAFVYLRSGKSKRREARDAFVVAAKTRPDVSATQDIVLGLDISLDDAVSAERHAKEALRLNRKSQLANYILGSLALRREDYKTAESYLLKAVDGKKAIVIALNDLAEVYRRTERFEEAELYARKAVKAEPKLYVAWETLGSIIIARKGNLKEAQECIEKACELSRSGGKAEDIRMLISLAKVQLAAGDAKRCKSTLRKVQPRLGELADFERREYDALLQKAR